MDRVKASGLDFPEASMLKRHLSAVNDWIGKAQSALAGSVPLRDLEKLLTEADKLAVDPGPKQLELQAKMDKALAWLEKLRKAVPKQRSTRRNAPDAETEKVRLTQPAMNFTILDEGSMPCVPVADEFRGIFQRYVCTRVLYCIRGACKVR